jgi:uncharacterized membrane protein YbhN (UPF0104 family)
MILMTGPALLYAARLVSPEVGTALTALLVTGFFSVVAAHAMGVRLPYLPLLLAPPVALPGQLLAFTPGALGVRELSWFAVLQAAGIPQDDLLTFLVARGVCIHISILVLALISQLIFPVQPHHSDSVPPTLGVEEPETQHETRLEYYG